MAVRLILSVVVGLALSLSPAAYAMKQLELKSDSHIAAIDIPLSGKEKAWLAAQPTLTVGTWLPERTPIVYDGDYFTPPLREYPNVRWLPKKRIEKRIKKAIAIEG